MYHALLLCMYHALLLQLLHMPHCLCLVTEKLHTCPLPARLFLHGWGCLTLLWQVHLCKAEPLAAGLLRLNVQVCPLISLPQILHGCGVPLSGTPLQAALGQFPHTSCEKSHTFYQVYCSAAMVTSCYAADMRCVAVVRYSYAHAYEVYRVCTAMLLLCC